MLWIAVLAMSSGAITMLYARDFGIRHSSKYDQDKADTIAGIGVDLFIAGLVSLAWQLVLWLKLW